MNSTRPKPVGLPAPRKKKRKAQATKAIIITFLMPNFFRKNGINRMHSVSDTCEMDDKNTLFFTAKALAYSGDCPKASRKGVAKPLVTCRHMPNRNEKMKNTHIFESLNSENARKPKVSTNDLLSTFLLTGQLGSVKA